MSEDGTGQALKALIQQLSDAMATLEQARDHAGRVLQQRQTGTRYLDILTAQAEPFVGHAGGRYRQEQAAALRAEGLSVPQIAELFGVSRQRIATLLKDARGLERRSRVAPPQV